MMSMKSANNELDKHYVHFIDIDIAKKSFVLATSLSPKTMITQHKAFLVATRFDEKIKTFHQRLRANGKPFKVAIVACMHKLLTILNAQVRDELQKASYCTLNVRY
ncbi:Uncharacterised protein [Moraxella equi]|uniref:Transposase n=1 Tax=Moraxella equi TaxID=60442 RepID=A0A378QPR4_9GAMM|nr:hypothetical protein B5J93_12785 [Moraxella equi]STZ02189.1 Uncharacterised protein [Moraxella equi]STZ02472.1 Uncharacterised protein [Moraxella equi]